MLRRPYQTERRKGSGTDYFDGEGGRNRLFWWERDRYRIFWWERGKGQTIFKRKGSGTDKFEGKGAGTAYFEEKEAGTDHYDRKEAGADYFEEKVGGCRTLWGFQPPAPPTPIPRRWGLDDDWKPWQQRGDAGIPALLSYLPRVVSTAITCCYIVYWFFCHLLEKTSSQSLVDATANNRIAK